MLKVGDRVRIKNMSNYQVGIILEIFKEDVPPEGNLLHEIILRGSCKVKMENSDLIQVLNPSELIKIDSL